MITHNPVYIEYATKVVNMMDGRIISIDVKDLIYETANNRPKNIIVKDNI